MPRGECNLAIGQWKCFRGAHDIWHVERHVLEDHVRGPAAPIPANHECGKIIRVVGGILLISAEK